MKNISDKIREARNKKGLSQSELAEKLFITKQSISKYENSNAIPGRDIMEKLEEILEINLVVDGTSKEFVIKKKHWISGLILTSLLILIITVLSVINYRLNKNYSELEQEYNRVISSNILDYNGVYITYRGSFDTFPEDMRFVIDMGFTNPTSASFLLDSELITIRIKLNDQSRILELTSNSNITQHMSIGSTLRASIGFYLTSTQINSIEWFEIYYGDMFVGKETL